MKNLSDLSSFLPERDFHIRCCAVPRLISLNPIVLLPSQQHSIQPGVRSKDGTFVAKKTRESQESNDADVG